VTIETTWTRPSSPQIDAEAVTRNDCIFGSVHAETLERTRETILVAYASLYGVALLLVLSLMRRMAGEPSIN
jgi:hypothetical protein